MGSINCLEITKQRAKNVKGINTLIICYRAKEEIKKQQELERNQELERVESERLMEEAKKEVC